MNLSDLITPQDDFYAITHRERKEPTPLQMTAKMKRLKHIFDGLKQCIMNECGPSTHLPPIEEWAHACTIVLLLDDAIEHLTTKKQI